MEALSGLNHFLFLSMSMLICCSSAAAIPLYPAHAQGCDILLRVLFKLDS